MSDTGKVRRYHCNECGSETNHDLLHKHVSTWSETIDERHEINGGESHKLVRCCGCEFVHLVVESWFSEVDEITVRHYPPLVSREKPAWIARLDDIFEGNEATREIADFLNEIYSALQNNSRRLALMGIRALLERMMVEKVGDTGRIGENVKKFVEQGYVAPQMEETFRAVLIEGGHAAMHRGYKPGPVELNTYMDLTEWLVASVYVHPSQSAVVRNRIPKRGS
ncbi:MAG: DUF4145 domain-containing protein [Pseudomonadota bacterium]|nr:DUF4145 domain-containing protein [Pseudomonadota bacterium]